MPPKRDLTAARLRRMGAAPEDIEKIRADKEHAERLAQLTASANARQAAPLPPGKGGPAPKPAAPAAAPAKVEKFRAIDDFKSDELDMEKGATVFVVGQPDADGNVQGVVGGKAGKIPASKLRKITPELLEEERKQREKEIEEARQQDEDALKEEMERLKLDHQGTTSSGPVQTSKGPKSAEQLAYEKQLEEQFEEERKALLAEEQRLKEEAAKLEAMLRALDEED
eukprot:m.94317 g.94317  ORF g.94317 m.94317 type:complete len:226 (+) comp14722_c0_seq2:184-861(+)